MPNSAEQEKELRIKEELREGLGLRTRDFEGAQLHLARVYPLKSGRAIVALRTLTLQEASDVILHGEPE
ncbi:MAG TPA: hypothetical protein VE955_07230 [Candidatus Dormibacteraeota bacterium]|jgi:hypothetical protein|nr:hypothetical protein [Candidatus Dormibacteraeota bacterium]